MIRGTAIWKRTVWIQSNPSGSNSALSCDRSRQESKSWFCQRACPVAGSVSMWTTSAISRQSMENARRTFTTRIAW
jgi:hypothetical protein